MSDQADRRPDAAVAPPRSDPQSPTLPGEGAQPPIVVSSLPDQDQYPMSGLHHTRPSPPPSARPASAPLPEPASTASAASIGPGAIVTTVTVAVLAVAAALVVTLADPRPPTAPDWHIVTVLGIVAVIGTLIGYRFNPPDDDSAPPWDVHTVWLLPAALLTPPSAFVVLVALSVVLGMAKRAHPLRWRIVVASITVLTTAALHGATELISGFAVSAVVGIAALWLIGAMIALVVAHVIGTPSGTVLWLDDRWTLVEVGCAFSGMLIAAAMRTDPNLGFTGLAPMLFAAFALRWPELTWHARIDPKTGLPNAWHWEERTRELLDAAEARNTPVAVMIIDIDRFKLVNDTYGHLAGDHVLNDLADVLRSEVRVGDVLGRFGGEEFVVTTFGLHPAVAMGAAERIRSRVAGQRHQLTGSRGTESCSITCTIGLATSHSHGYDLTRLLDLADIALAAGKSAGRNQVCDARSVLADIGVDDAGSRGGTGSRQRSLWRVATRRRSIWSVATRPRSDRRTLRHGPGSLFR